MMIVNETMSLDKFKIFKAPNIQTGVQSWY